MLVKMLIGFNANSYDNYTLLSNMILIFERLQVGAQFFLRTLKCNYEHLLVKMDTDARIIF
jgi:hypothetical protein